MARNSTLRAVGQDEQPTEAAEPKTVAQAAKSGTERELLVAMRDRIAKTVSDPDCPPRELGVLTKRLQDIVKDIKSLDAITAPATAPADDSCNDKFDASAV